MSDLDVIGLSLIRSRQSIHKYLALVFESSVYMIRMRIYRLRMYECIENSFTKYQINISQIFEISRENINQYLHMKWEDVYIKWIFPPLMCQRRWMFEDDDKRSIFLDLCFAICNIDPRMANECPLATRRTLHLSTKLVLIWHGNLIRVLCRIKEFLLNGVAMIFFRVYRSVVCYVCTFRRKTS